MLSRTIRKTGLAMALGGLLALPMPLALAQDAGDARATNKEIMSKLRLSQPDSEDWLTQPSHAQTPRIPDQPPVPRLRRSRTVAQGGDAPPITTGAGSETVTPAQRASNREIIGKLRLSKPSIDGWLKTPSVQQTPRIPKRN